MLSIVLAVALGAYGQASPPPIPGASSASTTVVDRTSAKPSGEHTPPSVAIESPDRVDPGEIIVVSAVVDRPSLPADLVQMKYRWIVLKNGTPITNYLPFPDNSKFVFGAGLKPAAFTVMLDVDVLYGTTLDADKKPLKIGDRAAVLDAQIDGPPLVVKTISVGDAPPPAPDPDKPDPPSPPTPPAPVPDPGASLTGNAKIVYEFVRDQTPEFTQDEKYKLAQAIGDSFQTMASKISAGVEGLRSPGTLLAATRNSNNVAIDKSGVPVSRLAGIKKTFGDWIYTFDEGGSFRSADDYASLWREIASGLKAVPAK